MGRDQSPYAWTKAANTELVRNYGACERAGDYGTVIEIFRQQFAKGETLTVVSQGTQKRNFTHVDDIVEGLMLVGEKSEGDDFGLGNEREYSILEVANMFSKEITMLPERPGNRLSSGIDTSKSNLLGWAATHDLQAYVKSVIGA